MNILLDTHVIIWWYEDPQLLLASSKKLIEDKENALFLSPAVLWEISIKQSLKKLKVPDGLTEKAILDLIEIPIMIKHTQV